MLARFFSAAFLASTISACGGSQQGQCPPGMFFDGAQCVAQVGGTPQCQPGTVWNGQFCGPAGGGPPPPPPPQGCPPGQVFNGQVCVAQGGPPPPPPPPPGGGQPGACAPAQTAPAGISPLLGPLAAQHAAGMRPVGNAFGAQVQQGGCVQMAHTLQPNRCYTVIAAGGPGVTNTDVKFVPISPLAGVPVPPIAQDQTQEPIGVLGKSPDCFKWVAPIPGQVNVVVSAAAGQGMVGAQIYEK